ncbi:MIR domain protein [Dictyocaulus viviparus]|uniref:MIR domain protein n=1 Tax=Dictyocaulus viviparus TaxID=29172 RepID=A0A0D8YF40_DICVI|nr:MIR domain protein [Dictyocaulus viviparus]
MIRLHLICFCFTLGLTYNDDSVTCGTVLKLANTNEGSRLHSHDVKYGSGSGQQSVTAVGNSDDVNSHWQIYPPFCRLASVIFAFYVKFVALKGSCGRGDPIKCGDKLRLKHLTTGCFLHSHHFQAPLSKHYQEISCFGGGSQSDTSDDWQIICDSDEWMESEAVKFKHVETGVYLALSGQQFGRPIHGQREVVGTDSLTNTGKWKAAEGVYMKRSND